MIPLAGHSPDSHFQHFHPISLISPQSSIYYYRIEKQPNEKTQILWYTYQNSARDKTKQKRNTPLDADRDTRDEPYNTALNSFNHDYLSYISGLVRAVKTPSKIKTQQLIDKLDNKNIKNRERGTEYKKQPINVVNRLHNQQLSPSPQKSYNDMKNLTVPIKKIKQIHESHEILQIKRQREKSVSVGFQKKQQINPLRIGKTFNLKQHYNRYPTQQAQKLFNKANQDEDLLAYDPNQSDSLPTRKSNQPQPQKQFLQNLDEYLHTLESQRHFKKYQKNYHNTINTPNDDFKTVEQVYQENIKFRKKIKKYQEKIGEIENNVQNHFMYCKKQEKSYKNKINQLTEVVFKAVQKINQQKLQIDQLKTQLKSFGWKAQHYIQKYVTITPTQQNDSSDSSSQKIHESLLKAIRPSRTHSEYKLKRKLNLPFFDLLSGDE